jgi:hypothetical protein
MQEYLYNLEPKNRTEVAIIDMVTRDAQIARFL